MEHTPDRTQTDGTGGRGATGSGGDGWHRLTGRGRLRVRGDGELVLTLCGDGKVQVLQLRRTAYQFEPLPGETATSGARRFPDPSTMTVVGGRGVLRLKGVVLDVTIDGTVDVQAQGALDLTVDGEGALVLPSGERRGWGLRPRSVKILR